jgi:hypothetical protein
MRTFLRQELRMKFDEKKWRPPVVPSDARTFTPEQLQERARLRREGKLQEPPPVKLAPSDGQRKRHRRSISVLDHTMMLARRAGKGNASRGIEKALEFWNDNRKRVKRK